MNFYQSRTFPSLAPGTAGRASLQWLCKAACLDAQLNELEVTLISDGHSTFHKEGEDIVNHWNKYLHDEGIQVITTADFIKKN